MDTKTIDANLELREAIRTYDLAKFRHALNLGAQPSIRLGSEDSEASEDSEDSLTIYEKALSTAGYHKLLRACLEAGCDPNYLNPQLNKPAIFYAADSKDPRNLGALLEHQRGKVQMDVLYKGQTALHSLARSLHWTECLSIGSCMKTLLVHGASPNIVDTEGKTPMQLLLHSKAVPQNIRSGLLSEFLFRPALSLANYREGLEFVLHNKPDGANPGLYKLLARQLLSLGVDELPETMAQYEREIEHWNKAAMHSCLLKKYMKHKRDATLCALLTLFAGNEPAENQQLMEQAIEADSWTTLLRLLQSDAVRYVSAVQLLLALVKQAEPQLLHGNDYQNCLQQLLMQDPERCLNQPDERGQTPLHYAVQYHNETAMRELLRHGARLGQRRRNTALPVEEMGVELLEEHFDSCITSRGQKPNDDNYEIVVNLMNLTNLKNELDMAPIAFMASRKELCPLLQHPLITCCLLLKWKRLASIFWSHFFIFMLFGFALTAHVLLRFPERTADEYLIRILSICCWMMVVYIVISLLLIYLMVRAWPSPIDPPLVGLLIGTCLECGQPDTQRIIAVLAIMLMACKLMLLIGALPMPVISTHMLMLRQVSRNFLCSLSLYSLLIITFGLCFHIQFGQKESNASDSDSFLTLTRTGGVFVQTLVMFAGQYEYGNFTNYYGSLVLLLFMFMSIILTNLLSGMAVGDTQTIRAQVELNAAICRTDLLNRYEGALKANWTQCDWFRRVFQKLTKIQLQISYGYLSIYPNQSGKAFIYAERHRNQSLERLADPNFDDDMRSYMPDHEDGESISLSTGSKYYGSLSHADIELNDEDFDNSIHACQKSDEQFKKLYIDHSIIKQALNIIKRKSNVEMQKQKLAKTEKRIEDIWTLLQEQKINVSKEAQS